MKYSALIAVLAFSVVVSFGSPADGVTVGDQVQDFSLVDVRTGNPVTLSSFNEGKGVVVIFVATQCPYSNAFNHVMADLARKYESKGIAFVGINSNKTEALDQVRTHAESNELHFPVLKDEGSHVADQFGATVTPEVFLIDANSNVVYHGALGNSRQPTTDAEKANGDELLAALDSHLAGREIERHTTKMFGCTIKR